MKKILLLIIFLSTFFSVMATHTKGGWMYYEYLGQGINNPNKLRYRIGLNYYIECGSTLVEPIINFSIYSARLQTYNLVVDAPVSLGTTNQVGNCQSVICYPCITNIPFICYQILNYETIVELDSSVSGYTIAKQRCCRIDNLSNLQSPSNAIGETYTINIPGVNARINSSHINASPRFNFNDTTIVCADNPFSISFDATDTDGDSLVYSFCDAYTGGSQTDPIPTPSSTPPFASVPYQFPYSGSQPLGSLVSINAVTGVVSGTAPPAGEYVVTICVAEYRNGILFANSRKELHLKVTACAPVVATMDPDFLTCGNLNLSFLNQSDGPAILNWFWTFGDPLSGTNDSSSLQFPSHTFTSSGVYTVKLIVNRGLACIDSTFQIVSVYPGFFPGFLSAAPFCTGQSVQFTDTTRTNFGTVSYWYWNFGDNSTLADTSRLQNPTYIYNTPGTYTIKLIAGNNLGCRDSILRTVTILPSPTLTLLSPDSSYCGLDSLQLSATGTGNFSWTPVTNILNANTANPTVFPSIPTNYIVTLQNQGCISRDTVRLTPVFDLTNNINALPTAICQEDTLTLTGSSNKTNNLRWQWAPAATVAAPNNRITRAYPLANTTYTLQTRWGNNCVVSNIVNIPVTPLAIPNAGPDTSFCGGQNAVQLLASGGISYTWSPAAGLNNTNTPNPTASPTSTTNYIVSVGVNGCSKRKTDTIIVRVRTKPLINITNDTLICIIDTLQLNVGGPGTVLWNPNYMINNTTSLTPLVSPDIPTLYRVRYTDMFGCYNDDSVLIDVKAQVTLNAGPDTSICRSEGFILVATGDAVSYTWTPNQFINNPNIKNPYVNPDTTITYTVVGNIGKCQAQSDVTVKVVPYPAAFAGNDKIICIGFDAQLNASGGSSYLWAPVRFLSNGLIANPVVQQPFVTMRYIVTVTDTLGCTKAINDTVIVNVVSALLVDAGPADTSIVEDELLLLNATGALIYAWSPATWLSNPLIYNPVANIKDSSIQYVVTGRDENGCLGTDSITVRVFKIDPDMYVPTAFTPDADGLNDVTRPILIGMKSLNYFRVYNRFGELMFATSKIGDGWNGIHKGKPQDAATFVWMAQGVTYKGQVRTLKGYVVLIR